jgi:hypothetical protein
MHYFGIEWRDCSLFEAPQNKRMKGSQRTFEVAPPEYFTDELSFLEENHDKELSESMDAINPIALFIGDFFPPSPYIDPR